MKKALTPQTSSMGTHNIFEWKLAGYLESSITFPSKEQRLTTVYPRINIIKHIMIYKYISYEWAKKKKKRTKRKRIYIE